MKTLHVVNDLLTVILVVMVVIIGANWIGLSVNGFQLGPVLGFLTALVLGGLFLRKYRSMPGE